MRWETDRGTPCPLTARSALMCVSHLMGPLDLARNCASLALETELFLKLCVPFLAYLQLHFWPRLQCISPDSHITLLHSVHCHSQRQPPGTARGHN